MLHAEAMIAHGRGDLGAARELLAASLAGVVPMPARYAWPLLWLAMRVEADDAVRSRDRCEAGPAAGSQRRHGLAGLAGRLPVATPPAIGCQAALAAEQARAEGTADAGAWAVAVRAWRTAGEPYPLAYALFRLAEARCLAADWPAATSAVREAHSTASDVGAQPLAGEAAALARRARLTLGDRPAGNAITAAPGAVPAGTGADSPSSRPRDPAAEMARFGLTERQREVFMPLAAGRSNPQIGTALFISPKTVSVHVSTILAKLACRVADR
jgi:DNA-binding CsgD family transcriptional regulator